MKDSGKLCVFLAISMAIIALDTALLVYTEMPMYLYWIILVVAMVLVFLPILTFKGTRIEFSESAMSIKAPFVDLSLDVRSILSVEMVDKVDIGLRTWGYGGIKRASGDFASKTLGSYILAASDYKKPMVVLRYSQRSGKSGTVAFNLDSEEATEEIYRRLTDAGVSDRPFMASPSESSSYGRRLKIIAGIVIGTIVIAIVVMIAAMGAGHISASLTDDSLVIDATLMSKEVDYDDITSVELRDDVDYGTRVGGLSNSKVLTGNFKNDEFGKYKLAVYKSTPTCIVVHTTGKTVVFNLESDAATEQFYMDLLDRIDGSSGQDDSAAVSTGQVSRVLMMRSCGAQGSETHPAGE